MKRIKIIADYYETVPGGDRELKFAAGALFDPKDEGAQRQLAMQNAEEVDVKEDKKAAAAAPEAPAA